jgi:hypothetical protein
MSARPSFPPRSGIDPQPHPADEFERFRELAKDRGWARRKSPPGSASTTHVVKQRLRLSAAARLSLVRACRMARLFFLEIPKLDQLMPIVAET